MDETPYQPTDRRPIAVRGWAIWQLPVRWLVRHGVSPNAISVAGMVCGIAAGVTLAWTPAWGRAAWLVSALLIQLRLLANLLDGMVAIAAGRASPLGEIYNEVPDRVSDAAILIGAGFAAGGDVLLGFWATCAALFTAYVRTIGKAAGAPQEFCGPMAKQQRMAIVTLVALYCGLTPSVWQPTWLNGWLAAGSGWRVSPVFIGTPPSSAIWGLSAVALLVIFVGCCLTSVRRLIRIAGNLRKRT